MSDGSNSAIGCYDAAVNANDGLYADIGFAKVDVDRKSRQGMSEVIYGEGKTAEQIAGILEAMADAGQPDVLITRLSEEKAALLDERFDLDYDELSRTAVVGALPVPDGMGKVVVATGGTSDIPVAEEAARTLEMLGNEVMRLFDVGVAGIHRLLSHEGEIQNASVIIAVAGMEGALPSVIGGLARCPVIAVPTSIGYGASFNGLAALLGMLNSCASGVTVVNIDNGFGAAVAASRINHPNIR